MRIRIESEEELLQLAKKLLHCSVNLRFWQKEWNEKHGGNLLEKKKFWEKKMDDLLADLGAEKTHNQSEVHISIKNENESDEKNNSLA